MVSFTHVPDFIVAKEMKVQLLEIPGINNVLLQPWDDSVRVGISHENEEDEVLIIAEELLKGIL